MGLPECKYKETPFAQNHTFQEGSPDLGIPRTKLWHRVVIVARLHPFREDLDELSPDLWIPGTKP
jgi:hypothetical protein